MSKYKPRPVKLTSHLLNPATIRRANRWALQDREVPQNSLVPPNAALPLHPAPPDAKPGVRAPAEPSGERRPTGKVRNIRRLPRAQRRLKIRAERRRYKLSALTRAKISAAQRGKPKSQAHKAKISAALKGHKESAAVRAKISAALRGKTISPEARAKISAALQGHPVSAATRAKLSLLQRGERGSAYRHGLYAAPTYPIHTTEDVLRALTEKQARLRSLLEQPEAAGLDLEAQVRLYELYGHNAAALIRRLRDRWKAQADAEAAEKLLADTLKLMEEIPKEEAEEEKEEPTSPTGD